jgi:hypothetical protein
VIGRREALALSALTAVACASSANASQRNVDSEQLEIVKAFYRAANGNNWAFVERLFADYSQCSTNDNEWFDWNAADPFKKKAGDYRDSRSPMRCNGPDEIYSYFRHRQINADWRWSLPNGEASIFSPEESIVVALVKKSKVDGGCWGSGPLCLAFQPVFLHHFDFRVEQDEGVVLSNSISELIEINLMEARRG